MRFHLFVSSVSDLSLGTGVTNGVEKREWKSSVKLSRLGGGGAGLDVWVRDMVRR